MRFVALVLVFVYTQIFAYAYTQNPLYIEPIQIDIETLLHAKERDSKKHSLSLIMVGDALLHTGVFKDAEFLDSSIKSQTLQSSDYSYSFAKMFVHIAPIISKYDLAFYNQETILGGKELGLSSYPSFNSPQEFGDTMLEMGFNLVSLANNHTLDKGERGVLAMLRYWHKQEQNYQNLCIAGSYDSFEDRAKPRIFEKNGISYAMLAYTYGTNGIKIPQGKEYLVNVYTKQMLKKDIQALRPQVDFLIVSMHWGIEYDFIPSQEQKELAAFLASLGVDLVIGNHPHVIQPIEWIDDTLVIYSLGNFISAQKGLNKRIGMISSLQVEKIAKGKVQIKNVRADLIYTYYDSSMRNFQIYPFHKLNTSILFDYKKIYKEYIQIITKEENKHIKIGL